MSNDGKNNRAQELFRSAQDKFFQSMEGEAAELLEEVVKLGEAGKIDPEDKLLMLSHRNLGLIYVDLDWYWKAIDHYEKALELGATKDNLLCRNLGYCYFDQDKLEEAIEYLRDAVGFNGKDARARYFPGWSYVELSERDNKPDLMLVAREQLDALKALGSGLSTQLEERIERNNRLRIRG
jgi:tetratricopeptide (TPR) repeat protein